MSAHDDVSAHNDAGGHDDVSARDDVSTREDDVVVRDAPATERYELFVSGRLAGLATYELSGDTMAIPHTEVQPEFEGRGLGARLAKFALDDARRRGLRVVPRCPFIAAYIRRHPEYADLVAPRGA